MPSIDIFPYTTSSRHVFFLLGGGWCYFLHRSVSLHFSSPSYATEAICYLTTVHLVLLLYVHPSDIFVFSDYVNSCLLHLTPAVWKAVTAASLSVGFPITFIDNSAKTSAFTISLYYVIWCSYLFKYDTIFFVSISIRLFCCMSLSQWRKSLSHMLYRHWLKGPHECDHLVWYMSCFTRRQWCGWRQSSHSSTFWQSRDITQWKINVQIRNRVVASSLFTQNRIFGVN